MMTSGGWGLVVNRLVASIPSMFGIRMSIRTRSGRSLAAVSTASRPSAASPQPAQSHHTRTWHLTVAGKLIHHSDAGSQSVHQPPLTEHLALEGIQPSIGAVGDAFDNALMEPINGPFKAECIRTTVFHAGPYQTIADVEHGTSGWVDWYNQRRLHGSLRIMSPVEFETAHYAALNQEPQTA
jgi:transposase InsO family protein